MMRIAKTSQRQELEKLVPDYVASGGEINRDGSRLEVTCIACHGSTHGPSRLPEPVRHQVLALFWSPWKIGDLNTVVVTLVQSDVVRLGI